MGLMHRGFRSKQTAMGNGLKTCCLPSGETHGRTEANTAKEEGPGKNFVIKRLHPLIEQARSHYWVCLFMLACLFGLEGALIEIDE